MLVSRLALSCGLLAIAGCGASTGCPAPADFAPVAAGSTPVFLARTSAGGVGQLLLLDADGAIVEAGPGGSTIWARTGSPLTGTPLGALGSAFWVARSGGAGGATLLSSRGSGLFAHIGLPSGAFGVASTLSAQPSDVLVVDDADGSATALVATNTGVAAYTRAPGGATTSAGLVVVEGEVSALVRAGTAVLALVTPPDGGPAAASSLLVIDPMRRAVVGRVALDMSLRSCRTMALLPPTPLDAEGVDARLAVGCRGVAVPGLGTIGAGYALVVVGLAPSRPPRVLGIVPVAAGTPRLVSALVGVPGGGFVFTGATADALVLVWVDVVTSTVRTLYTFAGPLPSAADPVGAGAYDPESRTLLWPTSASRVLRWTLPIGATIPVGPTTVSVVGCGVLPIVDIVALRGAGVPAPVDASVSFDAGTDLDAPADLDAAADLDAPPDLDAPVGLDAP